jgi:RNA polymerase sigma-70 factor (ECF subfamily)
LLREEEGAWGEFVLRYAARIYGWAKARNLADADCQDVTQEVLLKLFKRFKHFEYDPTRRFRDYLRTLTKNAVSDYVKSRWRQGQGRGDDTIALLLETEEARAELGRQIEEEYDLELIEIACKYVRVQKSTYWARCWRALPEFLGGKNESIEEAAAQLGIRPALISQALWQVKTALRRRVERLEGNAWLGKPFSAGQTGKDGPAESEDLP